MSIKGKPNVEQFDVNKDPSDFLDGAGEGGVKLAPVSPPEPPIRSAKIHREQKIFRLPMDLIQALKREAYEQSTKTGDRVTETDLVEKALRRLFKVK